MTHPAIPPTIPYSYVGCCRDHNCPRCRGTMRVRELVWAPRRPKEGKDEIDKFAGPQSLVGVADGGGAEGADREAQSSDRREHLPARSSEGQP